MRIQITREDIEGLSDHEIRLVCCEAINRRIIGSIEFLGLDALNNETRTTELVVKSGTMSGKIDKPEHLKGLKQVTNPDLEILENVPRPFKNWRSRGKEFFKALQKEHFNARIQGNDPFLKNLIKSTFNPNWSHQLSILESNGFAKVERKGRKIIWFTLDF